jgi:hypothetical protein
MLEQAVIDAQALKEAAIKNAEQEVLEKYAGEIKEAVDTLLEQTEEEDLMGLEAEKDFEGASMIDPAAPEPDEFTDQIPMKALDGQDACPCPEDKEVVELDLDALMKAASDVEDEEDEVMFEANTSDLENLLNEEMEDDTDAEDAKEEEVEDALVDAFAEGKKFPDLTGDGKVTQADILKGRGVFEEEELEEELEEEIELDEESLKDAIAEMLKVDLENVPRGDLGTTHPTKAQQIYAVDVAAAADESTENEEENAAFEEAVKKIAKLEEQVNSLKSDKNRLEGEHNELKSIARQVSEKLTELNTTNAKLVYKNRILESNSLNERQKENLVEAVSNANSTEEAKVIYETLQESLPSSNQNTPKNLREAISKNNRLVLKSNKEKTQSSDSAAERMKRLAGII